MAKLSKYGIILLHLSLIALKVAGAVRQVERVDIFVNDWPRGGCNIVSGFLGVFFSREDHN